VLPKLRREQPVDELTSEQEEAVAATVGAMAIVALPTEQRAAQYAQVRRNFETAITEFDIVVAKSDLSLSTVRRLVLVASSQSTRIRA